MIGIDSKKYALPIIKLGVLTLVASSLVKNDGLALPNVAVQVKVVCGLHVLLGSTNSSVRFVHLSGRSWAS